MSLCDSCGKPGSCCRGFVLSERRGGTLTFSEKTWKQDSQKWVEERGYPFFYPMSAHPSFTGSSGMTVHFECSRLVDGRCSDYENRPSLCQSFEAGSDSLCAMYKHTFRGIQIQVEHRTG